MRWSRVVIIGNGGSGKSTLALALARKWTLPHIELDRLASDERYNDVAIEKVNERLAQALAGDEWIVEGMHRTELSRWAIPRAQVLIWLDMPKRLILRRLTLRSLKRAISGQALVSDLKFVIRTTRAHDRRRALQLKLLQEATSAGAVTLSFTNPRDLERWLEDHDA